MKSYPLKELYKSLGKALKKLPFVITFHGKPRAVVIDYEKYERMEVEE